MTGSAAPLHDLVLGVCREWGVTLADFLGPRRHRRLVEARKAYVRLAMKLPKPNKAAIARVMFRHPSCIHHYLDQGRSHRNYLARAARLSAAGMER